MALAPAGFDADILRQRLMSPDPMTRAVALHVLELEPEPDACPTRVALATAAAKFVARGMPFYSVNDPHYCAWVSKAVQFWARLNEADGSVGVNNCLGAC